MKLLIIADDLSGAADCAIGFANAGHRTVVTLDASGAGQTSTSHDADVIAADTDTRRLTPADAAARTAQAFAALGSARRLYKKIDSTLRGNWAAEVAALQARAGLAIVAPAFPATGRTVREGALLVHGVPLERTDTWQLEHAGRNADMAVMLAGAGLKSERFNAALLHNEPRSLARRVALIEAEGPEGAQALIVDAVCAEDLRALAHATLELKSPFFWVGSGGLARELATIDAPRLDASNADDEGGSAPGPILVLVGSLSAVGERQCAVLRERVGLAELVVPPQVLRAGAAHDQWAQWGALIGATLGATLGGGMETPDVQTDLLLRIGRDDAFDPAEGAHLSAMLAALVAPYFARLGGLIATGGETARAMLDAAGIGSLRLIAEIEAGVAVARPHTDRQTQTQTQHGTHRPAVVTKAGAFGTDEALYAAWRHLGDKRNDKRNDKRDDKRDDVPTKHDTTHNPT